MDLEYFDSIVVSKEITFPLIQLCQKGNNFPQDRKDKDQKKAITSYKL